MGAIFNGTLGTAPREKSNWQMHVFGSNVQQFYGQKGRFFFDELYQRVNHQALAPFFRPWLQQEGWVLDAGSGSGHLAEELGLKDACFLDFTWEQIKQLRNKGLPGSFIRGDLQQLPFKDNTFDEVISSNVLHYTGLTGLKELLRVTKSNGQLLLAFLEGSDFAQFACRQAVFWGLFPHFMKDARFINIEELAKLNIRIEDSATVIFIPPFFQTRRRIARIGLVAFVLKKEELNSALRVRAKISSQF